MSPKQQETVEFSAKRLALLQFYVTTIEGLVVMIYRSDPQKSDRLSQLLQLTIRELQALAKGEFGMMMNCDPGEERCADGLCHPINDPTCSDIPVESIQN